MDPRHWYTICRGRRECRRRVWSDAERLITTSNNPAAEHRPLILLANEPRIYRESIAQVFRQLRPNVEVMTVEPDELDEYVRRLAPKMVIFSEATAVVRDRVPIWVELYPAYGLRSVVGISNERSTIENIQLSDLLSIVDKMEQLPR